MDAAPRVWGRVSVFEIVHAFVQRALAARLCFHGPFRENKVISVFEFTSTPQVVTVL